MADELDDVLMDEQEDDKKSNKFVIVIVTILIILIWLAIFALLVKLDVGGFGSNVLRPVLKDIPYINKILPEATDEETLNESKYNFKDMSEVLAYLEALENENLVLRDAISQNEELISKYAAEIARLEPFEAYQKRAEELKKQFDEQVVFGNEYVGNYAADPETYMQWYEALDPENAPILYQMAVERHMTSQVIVNLSSAYSKMKASQAASILEEMTGDMEKVAMILSNMSVTNAANILANMDPTYAAKITLLMYPSPYTMEEYLENKKQESEGKFPVGNPDGTHDGRN